jgi:hypothetical protein
VPLDNKEKMNSWHHPILLSMISMSLSFMLTLGV